MKQPKSGLRSLSPLIQAYDEAWGRFEARCLWNVRRVTSPTPDEALHVAGCLRGNGDMEARRLAAHLEDLAHAA